MQSHRTDDDDDDDGDGDHDDDDGDDDDMTLDDAGISEIWPVEENCAEKSSRLKKKTKISTKRLYTAVPTGKGTVLRAAVHHVHEGLARYRKYATIDVRRASRRLPVSLQPPCLGLLYRGA